MNASFDKIDSESAYREFLRMESRIEEMEVRVKYGTSAEANTEYSRSQYSDEVEAEIEKCARFLWRKQSIKSGS